jgi:hypothetical protein
VHLIKFFDSYLNYDKQPIPMLCSALTNNTFILCGKK